MTLDWRTQPRARGLIPSLPPSSESQLNATLGNAVELIVTILALIKCNLTIVQSSLVSSLVVDPLALAVELTVSLSFLKIGSILSNMASLFSS